MLPQNKIQRDRLLNYINQSVSLMREIDTLKEDILNVSSIVKDELEMSSKDYNSLVKVSYDQSKVESEIEQRQTAISEVGILKGDG
jgi:hypothetical protein